uniref:Uncharacterized protein n=1 Tax=Anguilla anguilla TaxID=7936 RepID=A0A0E9UVV8_ANGAN
MFMFPDRSLADISTVALFILTSAKHTSEETIQSNDYFLPFLRISVMTFFLHIQIFHILSENKL